MLPRGLRRGGAISTHALARAVENLVVTEESPVMPEREESLETDNKEIPDQAVITSGRHEHDGHGQTVENSPSAKTDHDDVSTGAIIPQTSNITSLASSTGATVGTPALWESCPPSGSEVDECRASRKRAPSNHYLSDNIRGHSKDTKRHSSYKSKLHSHEQRDDSANETTQQENRDSLTDSQSGRNSQPVRTSLSQCSFPDINPSCPSLPPSHSSEQSLHSTTPIEPYLPPDPGTLSYIQSLITNTSSPIIKTF